MRALAGLFVFSLLVACSDDGGVATTSTVAEPYVLGDCPVTDEAFCAVAIEAANALIDRDADTLLSLSRTDTIVCAEMNVELFPGCATQEMLEGHGISGPDLVVNLVDEADYLVHLRGTTTEIDTALLAFLGIGTCGPDEPERRTYHVAWIASVTDTDGTALPVVGSFEFNFIDEWRIVLSYVGTLEDWETQQGPPLNKLFCEAGRHPWIK